MTTPALRAAFKKGHDAAVAGMSRDACPYKDHRTTRGAVTFSRAYRKAWLKGFAEYNEKTK